MGPQDPGPNRWDFAPPESADETGLVGLGADLEPGTLVAAYGAGIFPWPHEGWPLPWFSPDPRAIITAATLHVSRRLARVIRSSSWTTTVDQAFSAVMASCAACRDEGTWITPAMRGAYERLHGLGWAHSVEVWNGEDLVGGIYGVQVGGVFTGESMFHLAPDASKVALADLVLRIAEAGGWALDAQVPTPHLESLGARAVSRREFLHQLALERRRVVDLNPDSRPARWITGRMPAARELHPEVS